MYRLAAFRGPVLVTLPDKSVALACLLSWRPKSGRNRARVQFPSGSERSVHVDRVEPPVDFVVKFTGEHLCMSDGTLIRFDGAQELHRANTEMVVFPLVEESS